MGQTFLCIYVTSPSPHSHTALFHFTGEETEAQRGKEPWPRPPGSQLGPLLSPPQCLLRSGLQTGTWLELCPLCWACPGRLQRCKWGHCGREKGREAEASSPDSLALVGRANIGDTQVSHSGKGLGQGTGTFSGPHDWMESGEPLSLPLRHLFLLLKKGGSHGLMSRLNLPLNMAGGGW